MAEPRVALAVEEVSAGYGETVVLESVSLTVRVGEAVSVIGRNGVGKSTLLATIMGHTTLHAGTIRLDGDEVTRSRTSRRAAAGLGYVPQEREIFPSLTVRENLAVAARAGHWDLGRVFELFPRLAERRAQPGNQLSGGEQQMLAIARALVGNPRVLLMDEPSEGLAPVIVDDLLKAMAKLRDEQAMAIMLVEQNSRIALAFAERTVVMSRGSIVRDGPSAELSADPALLDRLVGVDVETSRTRRHDDAG